MDGERKKEREREREREREKEVTGTMTVEKLKEIERCKDRNRDRENDVCGMRTEHRSCAEKDTPNGTLQRERGVENRCSRCCGLSHTLRHSVKRVLKQQS